MFTKRLYTINNILRYHSAAFLTETHQALKETCYNFAETELKPIAAKLDKEHLYPAEQIKKLGEIGLMGMLVPTDHGGSGLDTLSYSVAVEEISKYCASTGAIVAIHNALYANVVSRFGTPEQKKTFLSHFLDGSSVGCFALSEPGSGSDAGGMLTNAKHDGNNWILNGTKSWVTNANEAKAVVSFAVSDRNKGHRRITAFLIPIPTEGLSIGKKEDKLGIRATSTCSLILEDVKVSQDNILGKEGDGFKIAMSGIDCARIGISSQALGIAEAAFNCAINYASKRIAFGNPILHLQAVQHRISRMAVQLEASRLLTRRAALLRDCNQPFTKEASMAKLSASEAATSISHNCIQILGGMGYVTDMPAERYYRDARITEIYAGPTDIQLLVIADNICKEYGFKMR